MSDADMEWVSIGSGHRETPDGWWVIYDERAEAWQFGFQDMAMGYAGFEDHAKAECARLERNRK